MGGWKWNGTFYLNITSIGLKELAFGKLKASLSHELKKNWVILSLTLWAPTPQNGQTHK